MTKFNSGLQPISVSPNVTLSCVGWENEPIWLAVKSLKFFLERGNSKPPQRILI